MTEITNRDLLPHMNESGRRAVQNLTARTGQDIDELDPDEIAREASRIRAAGEIDDLDDGTVADCLGCPICHETRMDYLVWDCYGEKVTCARCNTTYTP